MVLDPLENLDLSDLPDYDAAQEYQALLRAVQRQLGFGIIFVRCSPDRGRRLIDELRLDLTQKHCEVLTLTDPLPDGDFFGRAMAFWGQRPADVVFVQGIEHSLLEYEETKRQIGWTTRERWSYSLKDIPPVLRNLNQQRDRFRNELQACFIFLVPLFTVRYMARRAPDFFDWRSGVFEFRDPQDSIRKRVHECYLKDHEILYGMSSRERVKQAMNIRELLDEASISPDERFHLLVDLGVIKVHEKLHENAFVSWRKALDLSVTNPENLLFKGQILSTMNKSDEEAIVNYDQALELKPNYPEAWTYRGVSLNALGRYEEAIASYDRALELNPDYPEAWTHRGISLSNLGRHEDAIASHNRALELNPDHTVVWSRGASLGSIWHCGEQIAKHKDKFTLIDDNQEIHARFDQKRMLTPTQILECLWSLNYSLQDRRFREYCTPSSRRAAAFIVQAKDSRIQNWLVKRLVNQLPNAANAIIFPFVVPNHPLWRYRDLGELWKDLSWKLRCTPDPTAIVEALVQIYRTKPVIIAMLGWPENQRSKSLQQQILSELWDPLVTGVGRLPMSSSRSRLILFLADGSNPKSDTVVSDLDPDHKIPIPLDPLIEISHQEVVSWLESDLPYQLLLDLGYTETQINTLIDNDIREWDRDPVKIIEQICYTFELRNGIAEIEPMWRLAG